MKNKHFLVPLSLLAATLLFFYKVFFQGNIAFPGDLLVAEYGPWSTYSYLGYVPGTFPNKAQYFDTLRQIYPWKTLSLNLLKKGNLPLWNPYNFSGSPLLANFQSAIFYPLNIFYFFLPQPTAWTLLIILQPLLAGLFTYLFTREIGLKRAGALIASLAFAFSGFMTVFLEYNTVNQTVLWLPLIGYFFERLLKKQSFWRFFLFVSSAARRIGRSFDHESPLRRMRSSAATKEETPSLRAGGGFILSLAMPFLAGHLPSAVLLLAFIVIYIFFRIFSQKWSLKNKVKFGLKIAVLLILSLGIAAIQLIPTGELIGQSARAPHDYHSLVDELLTQPKQLIMLLVPDFFGNPATRNYWLKDTYVGKVIYIGLIPVLFSFFAAFFLLKKSFVRFFSLATVVIFSLIVSWPLTRFLYRFKIPLFSTSSPGNAIFLVSFSLAILAGFGLDKWFEEKNKKKWLIGGVPLFIFLFIWLLVLIIPRLPQPPSWAGFLAVSQRNLLYSSFVLFLFLVFLSMSFLKKKRSLVVALMILISIFDLFYFFRKFNPFIPEALVFPQAEILSWLKKNAGFNRFWGYGTAGIEANFASQEQLFSSDGYDPLYPRRYGEFIYASNEGQILEDFGSTTRSDARIASGFGETDLVTNPYRERVLSLLGVRYVLDRLENASTEKTFPDDRYRLIWESQNWRVFENLLAVPRVFLVSDYLLFENKKDFEKIFFAPDFKIQEKILLEEEPEFQPESAKSAQVEFVSYTPNKVVLETNSDARQLLFLSDTFYLGWQAFVDDQETKIYRANYAFRAIAVPEGEHQILFRYQPKSFTWGVRISLVSLVLVLVFSFLCKKSKSKAFS